MRSRHSRTAGGRPRRRPLVWLVGLATLAAAVWFAPAVAVLTRLRDRPLEMALAGIDGHVASRAAVWRWWGGIEYRDVTLCDRQGRPLVAVPRLVIDRGLVGLLVRPRDLGTVRLVGGEVLVEVRPGGSSIEDVLAPWLASASQSTVSPPSFELEVVDAAVELVDLARDDAWRITDILAAGTVRPDATLAGWTISGRARYAGAPLRDLAAAANRVASDRARHSAGPGGQPAVDTVSSSARLDRTTVAAGATAILARDGGWSVSSPDVPVTAAEAAAVPRSLAVAATRLPLGVTSVAATRFAWTHVLDGLVDVRLDISLPPSSGGAAGGGLTNPGRRPPSTGLGVSGVVSGTKLAFCGSDTLAEIVTLDRAEMPLDISVEGERVVVRSLAVSSRLFSAEASGRIRLPVGDSWDWAEALVTEDFAVAVDVDLAAAARAMPAGLAVRPDVRVTGGQVQLTAASRADGHDRVLEVRTSSRDVAAIQTVPAAPEQQAAGAAVEERLLRWSEPFTGWLRGRRGPARGDRLRIEEARLASPAIEVSAAGTAASAAVQWTIDLGGLAAEAAEVIDLAGARLQGSARGRIDVDRVANAATSRVKLSASLTEFEFTRPGAASWRDPELTLVAEGSGGMAGAAVLVDRGHALLSAADDSLEVTLTGGALINPWLGGEAAGRGMPWLRAAPGAEPLAADCSLTGELSRWCPRWAAVMGPRGGLGDVEVAGRLKAQAVLTAQGDAWQITRAGGEIEKLSVRVADRRIVEPRVVATAAGRWNAGNGAVEISSAEFLTATLSVRTGGCTLLPASGRLGATGAVDAFVDRLRGKVQWQCDLGRIERWLLPTTVADRWPVGGRGWGTAELVDTPLGLNVLVEATGSQLSLASRPAGRGRGDEAVGGAGSFAGGAGAALWSEPRATLVAEVTCPRGSAGDRMTVNRLAVESSTAAVAAAGSIEGWSSRRLLELGGNVAYDWEQVSRLATPWTGGRLRLVGAGARPFTLRTPLDGLAAAGGATAAAGGQERLPLPEDWLSAAGGPRGQETVGRIARPASVARPPADLAARLRAVSIDTSAAWTSAEIAGVRIEPGEMVVRLFEGQLALGPFDLGTAGGRLRGAPWLRLLPAPGELVVPPGRCLDRIVLTRQLCDRWVSWLVPLVGHSAQMQGLMSVDMAGARLPLADPFGGEASGQVIFESLEATPGEAIGPLMNLIVKLQSAIDPRFAFGDKAVLLRVRPEPVSFRLADRRLWHEGLVIDAGQLVVRSAGSVGADGALAMVVEVAFRGDIAGATPVVGQLLRTPLVIPLKGTVQRPQFDAGAIDTILGRVVENTAEAVIGPSLSRGLETLFGNPQPAPAAGAAAPAQPPPLVLPQSAR